MALHKKGVPFTLYEDAREFSAVGYVIIITMLLLTPYVAYPL